MAARQSSANAGRLRNYAEKTVEGLKSATTSRSLGNRGYSRCRYGASPRIAVFCYFSFVAYASDRRTMFPEINNFLDINPSSLPNGKCIVVKQCGTDGSFLLHHLLSLYGHGNCNACLVGVAQTYNHYKSVADKVGSSLNKRKESGQFAFIDALKEIGQITIESTSDDSIGDVNTGDTLDVSYLKRLYFAIKSAIQQLSKQGDASTVLVMIDDLTMLLHLGIPVLSVIHFVQYLRQLVCPTHDSSGCLTVLVPQDLAVEDDDLNILVRQLCHSSDMILHVSGLESGFCRDVHGKVMALAKICVHLIPFKRFRCHNFSFLSLNEAHCKRQWVHKMRYIQKGLGHRGHFKVLGDTCPHSVSICVFNSIYFKMHNIKSNAITNNKSHGTNEIQLRNVF